MSLIFLRNRVTTGGAFSPATLFASGEEGAWYEPSTTTCFTDTGGTVAATYGDGVAYLQDLSGNGNHATQVTAGARPILARVPPRGRVNELSETDTLATQSVTVTADQRTLSFKGTGTVTLSGASTAGPLVGTGAEDRVSLTFTPSSGTLTLTVLGTVTDAQLEPGSAVTNYQLVADLLGYDITEAGVTSLEYLSFNGASNGMATASIDFTATDKMSVFAGVEKESDATLGQLVELSASVVTNNGSFSMPSAVSGASWDVFVKGTGTLRSATATSFAAPIKTVNTGLYDLALATGDAKIRVDGTLRATSAGDTGGGNFGNYPLYIGARNNAASVWLNGKIFGMIVRGAASTAQEISDTEAYLASRSGVTL